MTLVSFAQNQEDVLLWRALQHVSNGFYIDVGAADPVEWSVTKVFYDHGWHGINLEPQAAYFALLGEARPHDINLSIAAGRATGQLTFHRIDNSGLSTFDSTIADGHRAKGWDVVDETIEVRTLAEICEQYRPHGPIHFLKVDVEGSEGDVLAGGDFKRFRPWIIVVEATLPMSQEESFADWETTLTSQAYTFVWFDGLNRYYLADEHRDELGQHFRTPPNVFDGFEPTYHLLLRAERAESSMQHVRNEAAGMMQEADAASRRALDAMEHMSRATTAAVRQAARAAEEATQEARRLALALAESTRQSDAALADSIRRSDAALAEQARRSDEAREAAEAAREAARVAEAKLAHILHSSSWRVTAPLRVARRVLSRGPRGVLRGFKELARRTFRFAMHIVLSVPGVRRCVRFVFSVAPGPVEWLARRYRAYEQGAADRRGDVVAPAAAPAAAASNRYDEAHLGNTSALSDDEARVYRQFVAYDASGKTS